MQLQDAAASGERHTIPTKGIQLWPAGNVVCQGVFLGGHNMAAKRIQRGPHANHKINEHATAYVKTLRAAAHAKRQQVIPRDHIESEIDHGWGWVSDYASEFAPGARI